MLSKKVVLIGGGIFYLLFLLLTPLGLFNDWVPPLSHSGYYSVKTVDGGDDTGITLTYVQLFLMEIWIL
jgi:hypothetical protein